jgi:hypothetical protein
VEPTKTWIQKNWGWLSGLLTSMIIPFIIWVGNSILEGENLKGYNKAKIELNEEYNNALRDAIIFRAKYDACCRADE